MNTRYLIPLLLLAGLAMAKPAVVVPKVLAEYPHDTQAFTQGLEFSGNGLYEGTGLDGKSELRKVDLKTGKVLKRQKLDKQYFGEGITVMGNNIYQITWKNKTGFVYNKNTFKLIKTFEYPTEGWGLTHNSTHLIMSDGSDKLYFLDPKTLKTTHSISVTLEGKMVFNINELEWVKGKIYANIWQTPWICIIDPATGNVETLLDLRVLAAAAPQGADVLNGIAYDSKHDSLYVTGKLWPKIYQISLN